MIRRIILQIILAGLIVAPVYSAKFSGDAFSLGVGARGLALGGAMVAGPFDGTAIYWNPAGMNLLSIRSVSAMHAETFGSLLNHDFIAYQDSRKTSSGRKGMIKSFGFYFYYLGGGGIKLTGLNEFNRPEIISEESHGDYLLAAAMAGKISERLHFGLTAKLIYRDLGTEAGQGLTVDGGLLYDYSKNINLGLMITDLTTGFIRYSGASFDEAAHSESIYPTIKPGLMAQYDYYSFTGRFMVSSDIKFENLGEAAQISSGSFSLDSHFGWELAYKNSLFGRAGFDIGRFTAGAGFIVGNINFDLAYLHHDELDETYRVSAGYSF